MGKNELIFWDRNEDDCDIVWQIVRNCEGIEVYEKEKLFQLY
jgi:hypothetical protein